MKRLLPIILILMMSACGTQVAEQDAQQAVENEQPAQTAVVADTSSFCSDLSGQIWQSVEELDAGRSLNGVAKMHWKLGFENGQFRWRYADVVESGTYTCDGDTVLLISALKDPRATASFDVESSELVINNLRYVLQAE